MFKRLPEASESFDRSSSGLECFKTAVDVRRGETGLQEDSSDMLEANLHGTNGIVDQGS